MSSNRVLTVSMGSVLKRKGGCDEFPEAEARLVTVRD